MVRCLFKRTSVIVLALVLGLSGLVFAPGAQAEDYDWNYEGEMLLGRTSFVSAELPDGTIFVSMGFNEETYIYLADTWIFDPESMDWTPLADAPYKMTCVSGTYLNGRVYVFGGQTDGGGYIDSVLIYDIETDVWSVSQDLPLPLVFMACVAVDDMNILVVGGDQKMVFGMDECYLFNVDTEVFTPVASLPEGRACGGIAMADGIVYYIGGWDSDHNPADEVFAYDVQENEWTLFSEMDVPRLGMATVTAENGLIYLIGGAASIGWSATDVTDEVLTLNPVDGKFGEYPSILEPAKYGAAFAVGSKVLYFGGHDGPDSRTDILSLENIRTRAELTDDSVEQGNDLWARVWVDTEMEYQGAIYATVYVMQGNTSWGVADLATGQGGEAYLRIFIPEDLPAGEYRLECYWASLGVEYDVRCPLEPMAFTVVEAPSVDDRIDELQGSNDDLQDQLDSLQEELNDTRTELKEAVDAKLDAMIGLIILIVAIGALIVGVVILVRKK